MFSHNRAMGRTRDDAYVSSNRQTAARGDVCSLRMHLVLYGDVSKVSKRFILAPKSTNESGRITLRSPSGSNRLSKELRAPLRPKFA